MIKRYFLQFSHLTLSWAIFIVISASFMRQLLNMFLQFASRTQLAAILYLIFGVVIIVLAKQLCAVSSWKCRAGLLSLAVGLLYMAIQMQLPEERVHVLKFGLLGFLASKDTLKLNSKSEFPLGSLIMAGSFAVLVGFLDEGFQALLPYRVADIRDVFFDGVSGCGGALICYLLSKKSKAQDSCS